LDKLIHPISNLNHELTFFDNKKIGAWYCYQDPKIYKLINDFYIALLFGGTWMQLHSPFTTCLLYVEYPHLLHSHNTTRIIEVPQGTIPPSVCGFYLLMIKIKLSSLTPEYSFKGWMGF